MCCSPHVSNITENSNKIPKVLHENSKVDRKRFPICFDKNSKDIPV